MNPKEIVRSGYDKISHTYRGDDIDLSNPDHQHYINWVRELLTRMPDRATVLDLGCGNGIPTTKLLTDSGCHVTGVDLSPVQIARTQTLVPQAAFICADMTERTLPPERFAAIVSFYAMIHIHLPSSQPCSPLSLTGYSQADT